MSPETASNRYVRSGFASANYLMGNVYSVFGCLAPSSRAQASAEWREARSWYQKSLALWIDKEKRGELESDERTEQQQVLTQIARCDAELHEPTSQADTNVSLT